MTMYVYNFKELYTPDEVIAYLRKSRSDDPALSVDEVLSRHETILDDWAIQNLGETIPACNKFREVVSGETLKDRPEINIVLRMVESPKYKAIAVVEPQRLSRGDLEDIGRLMKLLKHTHTNIITPQRVYDLEDDYDWDAFERELKRGNEYLEYTKKILNRGKLLSVSQGNFIGSVPPYGYEKVWVKDGKRKCPTLAEKKEEADVVRMVFDMYVNQDMGRTKICNQLDSLGIKPPKGDYWSPPALKDMLSNEHYIGKVKWNWRKTVTIVEDSEIIQTRPKAKEGDYLLYDGRHEGIIPEELFQAAQEKRRRNHRAKASTKIRNPFASLVWCQCGRAMSMRTNKLPDGRDRYEPRIVCDGQNHCHTSSCTYQELANSVINMLEEHIEKFEVLLKNGDNESAVLHERLIANLEKKLKELEKKELAQWEAQADPDPMQRMPQAIFRQLNEKLQQEKKEVRQALQRARETAPERIDYREKIALFQDAVDGLKNDELNGAEKNRLLKRCVERIIYSRPTSVRLKKEPGEKKGERFKSSGGKWKSSPMALDIKLNV